MIGNRAGRWSSTFSQLEDHLLAWFPSWMRVMMTILLKLVIQQIKHGRIFTDALHQLVELVGQIARPRVLLIMSSTWIVMEPSNHRVVEEAGRPAPISARLLNAGVPGEICLISIKIRNSVTAAASRPWF
jgi:alkylated DNA nucleotide flippase Atl1